MLTYTAKRVLCIVAVLMTIPQAFGKAPAGDPSREPVFTQQAVFSAGERGFKCFRIPAMVVSTRGTILVFAEGRKTNCKDEDEIALVLKRSTDQGRTWGPLQVVYEEGTLSVNQPAPVVDRQTGEVLLVFCKNNQRAFFTRTRDDGLTWAEPKEITQYVKDPSWKYLGSGPGHGIQLKSGRLLIPSWGDTSPGKASWRPAGWGKIQFSFVMYSDDHGLTWKRSAPMESDASDECMAVEIEPNRIYMDMRSRQNKLMRAHSWSEDGGITWSKIAWNEDLPAPSCQGSALCMTRNENSKATRVLLAHPSDPDSRSHLTVYISYDQAKTWAKSKLIDAGVSAYSDLAVSSDGDILCFYESGAMGDRLVLARFNLEWLTEKADRLPN